MKHTISGDLRADTPAFLGQRYVMASGLAALADSEKEVLVEITEGFTNKGIADRFGVRCSRTRSRGSSQEPDAEVKNSRCGPSDSFCHFAGLDNARRMHGTFTVQTVLTMSYKQISNCNPSSNMTTLIKRIVVLLFVTSLLFLVGVGCNTAHGFGKDLQKAGEGIQDGTK